MFNRSSLPFLFLILHLLLLTSSSPLPKSLLPTITNRSAPTNLTRPTQKQPSSSSSHDIPLSRNPVVLNTEENGRVMQNPQTSHSKSLAKGFFEVFEWFVVFILIAPGTFPLMGVIFLTCISCARRRMGQNGNANGNEAQRSAGDSARGVGGLHRNVEREGMRDRKHEDNEESAHQVLVGANGATGQSVR